MGISLPLGACFRLHMLYLLSPLSRFLFLQETTTNLWASTLHNENGKSALGCHWYKHKQLLCRFSHFNAMAGLPTCKCSSKTSSPNTILQALSPCDDYWLVERITNAAPQQHHRGEVLSSVPDLTGYSTKAQTYGMTLLNLRKYFHVFTVMSSSCSATTLGYLPSLLNVLSFICR